MIAQLRQTYTNRCILLTGEKTALGQWLSALLTGLGAQVHTLADDTPPEIGWSLPALWHGLKMRRVDQWICAAPPRPRTPQALRDALTLLAESLLAAQSWRPGSVLLLLDDSAYRNSEAPWACAEEAPLGGASPEGCAQACLRLFVEGFRTGSWGQPIPVAIAHHGPLLGSAIPADPPDDADAPGDAWLTALNRGQVPMLAHPDAQMPFQFAPEALAGALLLGDRMLRLPLYPGETMNVGASSGNWCSRRTACRVLAEGTGIQAAPDVRAPGLPPAPVRLDSEKARQRLGWRTLYDAEESLRRYADWFARCGSEGTESACQAEIRSYLSEAQRAFG